MTQAIIVSQDIRDQAFAIINYSQNNIVDLIGMHQAGKIKPGQQYKPPGDENKHTLMVPPNYKTVYSLEDQGETSPNGKLGLGICRHFSMSSSMQRAPSLINVDMMLDVFQFDNPLYKCIVWAEEIGKGHLAVNVIEPLKGWPNEDIANEVETNCKQLLTPDIIEVIDARREQDRKTLRTENGGVGTNENMGS